MTRPAARTRWLGPIAGLACVSGAAYFAARQVHYAHDQSDIGVRVFQQFNEIILRPSAIILDIAVRTVRALFAGGQAALAELTKADILFLLIGVIVIASILLALAALLRWVIHALRVKEPGPFAVWVGSTLFWLGCVIGAYFLGLTVYAASFFDGSAGAQGALGFMVGTAVLWPAIGWGFRYMLGRKRLNQ